MLRAEVLDSIDRLDPLQLDELADRPLYTWGWLRTLEGSDVLDMLPRHIAIWNGDSLAGFAPCFLEGYVVFDDLRTELLSGRQNRMLRMTRRLRLTDLDFSPALIAGIPESFSSDILVARGEEHRSNEVIKLFLETLRDQARTDGAATFGMNAVAESNTELGRHLVGKGYSRCLRNANAVLNIAWASFDEYLASLRKNKRKSVKHATNRFHSLGFTSRQIGAREIESAADRLSELARNVYTRHGNAACPFSPSFYRSVAETMRGRVAVNLAERNGTMVAFSLDLSHGSRVFCHHWGTDYSERSRKAQVYFHISYHIPISRSIGNHRSRIEFGPAAWGVKASYGCRFEKIYVYLKTFSRTDSVLLRMLLKQADRAKRRWLSRRL